MFNALSNDVFDLVDEPGVAGELAALQGVAPHLKHRRRQGGGNPEEHGKEALEPGGDHGFGGGLFLAHQEVVERVDVGLGRGGQR